MAAGTRDRWNLFLCSFTILFIELVCIRWIPAYIRYLGYFTNVVLLGSGSAVADRVDAMRPQLIVTSEEALSQWPEIATVLARDYELAFQSYPDSVYLRRPGH